ncbi:hypothetical protein AM501_24055 [Aneurinibacillus migulanus]|uniref:5' nucleotidase, NT5C type n=1 Tax=Aneurinibacillus migulanus TaxID=47500 RepID=UPI0005BC04C4|nr:hypothetical protein [Aneurinibacillus migulanus]KIV58917.1 hypothetical protein TS64_03925 [Aneurinibacillus migulanus]KPD05851.1 hypothetical protein AM501_24055 [Aneurinibacillus migulanus]
MQYKSSNSGANTRIHYISVPVPASSGFFEINPDVFEDAYPLPDAAQSLQSFVSAGHTIYYVTARGEWSRQVTQQWLLKHHFPIAPLIFTVEKDTVACAIKATVAFEDSPGEIDKLSGIIPDYFCA